MRYTTSILLALALVLSISVAHAASSEGSNIKISQISQTPDPVEPGDYVELRFRVDNLGAAASDYVYELDYNYPFSLDPGSPDKIQVGQIDSYQVSADGATLYWKVRVDPNAVPGSQNTVKIRYYPRNGSDSLYVTQPFTIRVGAQEGLLVVSNATIKPSDATPGKKVTVSIDLENLGSADVKNVRVSADVTGTSFAPYGSANGRLVRRIGAGSTASVGYDFFVSPDASLGVEKLPFSINYTDSVGAQYSLKAVVGVPINEQPSYLASLESTGVYTAGQKGDVVFSISNTGSSPLNFVVLSVDPSSDYEIVGPAQTYLGNLQSDDFETGQYTIYVNKDASSPLPVNLTITYRTAYGEERTETRTIDVPLYSEQRARELGLMTGGSGVGTWVLLIIVLVAIGGFVWWRRRKGRKER